MPNADELCEVSASSGIYRDWTSVSVRCAYRDPDRHFQLQVVEVGTLGKGFDYLRLKPGDPVQVSLAGEEVIGGFVLQRQVAYDARRHAVQVDGKSRGHDITVSSVDTEKTGQFQNYTFSAIAKKVLAPHGVTYREGKLPEGDRPFENVAVHYGETVWQFLERIGRMRRISLTADADGNLVGGDPGSGGSATLEEGRNILRARCVINDLTAPHTVRVVGQGKGSDQRWGKTVSQVSAEAKVPGSTRPARIWKILAEEPGMQQDMKTRGEHEVDKQGKDRVEVEIVVRGWLRPSGGLWNPGDAVSVKSPMLFPSTSGTMALKLVAVTFSQDAAGTYSTLELCDPIYFGQRFSGENTPALFGGAA